MGTKEAKVFGDLTEAMNSAGLYTRSQMERYTKFNRTQVLDPYNTLLSTREYVFFTKPNLHIFEAGNSSILNKEIANVPIFEDAIQRYKPVLKQLQLSASSGEGPFMNLLCNMCRSAIDLPGISANQIETSANIYGTKLAYRKDSYQSDEAHDFSIEFEDTRYLEVYMLFKLFDEYERRKYYGEISPTDLNYRFRKILHDQIAIYKFIVDEDGETLLYWAKLYGCYPTSVPRDSMSDMSSSGGLRFTVSWHSQFVEDSTPEILADFNRLIKPLYSSTYTRYVPVYNKVAGTVNHTWAGIPCIVQVNTKAASNAPEEMDKIYKLKWRY